MISPPEGPGTGSAVPPCEPGRSGNRPATGPPGRQARTDAVTSFALLALRSLDVTLTEQRSIEALTQALAVPAGSLSRLTGGDRTVVLYSRGDDALPVGAELAVDPAVLTSSASRLTVGPGSVVRPASTGRPGAASSDLAVLVSVEGDPWGLLHVPGASGRAFGPDDEVTARTVAAILGAAVERHRHDRRQEALASLGRYAVGSRQVLATTGRTVEVARDVLRAAAGAVVRLARPPSRLAVVYAPESSGAGSGRHYDVHPRLVEALQASDPLVVADCRGDVRFSLPLLPGSPVPHACALAALHLEGRRWGWLLVTDTRPRRFTAADVEVLAALAATLSMALQRKRAEWAWAAGEMLTRETGTPADATEVALLDRDGVIVWVNRAWRRFSDDNGGDPDRTGVGVSYLERCDAGGDEASVHVAEGIRAAVRGDLPAPLRVLIPCASPDRPAWFDVLISSRLDNAGACVGATVTLSPAD